MLPHYRRFLLCLLTLSVPSILLWISYEARSVHTYDPLPNKAIKPIRVIGPGNDNATFTFGIPHIRRSRQNYLLATMSSLLLNVPESQRHDVLFVLMLADRDQLYVNDMINILRQKFNSFIDGGILQIILPNPDFYPDISQILNNPFFFGDRLKLEWTSKQNYDYAYLMLYCYHRRIRSRDSRRQYYIQMEDDIKTHIGYIHSLRTSLTQPDLPAHWFVISYSTLGFIGKMFHTDDLLLLARFLLTFHAHKPADWLLDYMLPVIACSHDESDERCRRRLNQLRYQHVPSLFQHVGVYSSLKGKIQPLKDNDYLPVLPR